MGRKSKHGVFQQACNFFFQRQERSTTKPRGEKSKGFADMKSTRSRWCQDKVNCMTSLPVPSFPGVCLNVLMKGGVG